MNYNRIRNTIISKKSIKEKKEMKKFPKLIAGLLLISLLCGVIAVSVAATDGEEVVETNQLAPEGATNLTAIDFNDANAGKYLGAISKVGPVTWTTHSNSYGNDRSFGFRYDGKSTTNPNANGINIDIPMMTFGLNADGTAVTKTAISNVEDSYDYLVYEFDFGTDAYLYESKTYTLAELAELEETNPELVTAVKRYGKPAYHPFNNFGPLFRGTTSYYYGAVAKQADGRYAIVSGSGSKITNIEHDVAYLSNKVGVYDHFTMVVDFATGREETKGYIYYYLNGERFATFEIANANGLQTDCFRVKQATGGIEVGNTKGINLADTYSVVFDNLAFNGYTAEQAANTLEKFFGAEEPAIDDLTACAGVVYTKNYVYGSGHKYADLQALKPAEGTVLSQDFNTGTDYNFGGYSGGAEDWSKYNVTAAQKWMPDGNGYFSVSVGATASGNTQMYTYNPLDTNKYDYITFDVDISTDLYAYGGSYYTVQDVEALKASDPELAAKIEADGVATYIDANQLFTINAGPKSVMGSQKEDGTGTPYTLWGIKKNASGKYVMYWAAKTPLITNNYTTEIELSNKVGAFDHFTVAVAINHTDSTKTAVYSFVNGKVLSAHTVTNSFEPSTQNLLGFKVLVNAKKNSALAFDNILLRTYDKGYTSTDFNGIDDLLGKQYSADLQNKIIYDYEDVTYNKNYVTPENSYVSLDDVNKAYIPALQQEVIDSLEEGGTLYLSGAAVSISNFASDELANFTVVCKNGATFSTTGSFKTTAVTENGVTTYTVEPNDDFTNVEFYYGEGEEAELLYTTPYVIGETPVFDISKVENPEQFTALDVASGKILSLGTTITYDSVYSDEGYYDEETGKIIENGGTICFYVDTAEEAIAFLLLDANGDALDVDVTLFASANNIATLYNTNRANVAELKFFGNGVDHIKWDATIGVLSLAENAELTINLNGQIVEFAKYGSIGALNPMVLMAAGSTLNIKDGDLFHVLQQQLGWMANSSVIRNQAAMIIVNGAGATVNLGVEGDSTKALNFYGTSLIKYNADATTNIYGGTYLTGNLAEMANNTAGNNARGLFCLKNGTVDINIDGANLIGGTHAGIFWAEGGSHTIDVTNSKIVCQSYTNENRPCTPANTLFPLFDARGTGTATFTNTVIVASTPLASTTHTINLGKNVKTNWSATDIANAANNIKTTGLEVVGASEAYSEAFTYATEFEPIINTTHGKWDRIPPKGSPIPDDFFNIDAITHTATLLTIVIDANDRPENVTKVVWNDINGKEVFSAYYTIGATPTHPNANLGGVTVLDNGWYNLAYSAWDGSETVVKDGVYTPANPVPVAALSNTKVKVSLTLSSHAFIQLLVLNETDVVSNLKVRGDASMISYNGADYVYGEASTNSTWLDNTHNIPVTYTVTYEGTEYNLTATVSMTIIKYVDALLAADTKAQIDNGRWYETLATFLQYRYNNYIASGATNQDSLKATYEGYFKDARLAPFVVKDYTTYNPVAEDMDADVDVSLAGFGDYIEGAQFVMNTNQPYMRLYLNKALIDALDLAIEFKAYPTLGLLADNVLTYSAITPTVQGTEVQFSTATWSVYFEGENSVALTETLNAGTEDAVECYMVKIIIGELCNLRAVYEFSLAIDENTTLTCTYSLLEYINDMAEQGASAEVQASVKALYNASVASWNYKVTEK